jgi:hypothetical protein
MINLLFDNPKSDQNPFVDSEFYTHSYKFINIYELHIILEIGSENGIFTSFFSDALLHNQNSYLHYLNPSGYIFRTFLSTIKKSRNPYKIRFFTLKPSNFFDRYKFICNKRYTLIYVNVESYGNNQETLFYDLQNIYTLLELHGLLWITNSHNTEVQKFLSLFKYYFDTVHHNKEIGLKRIELK